MISNLAKPLIILLFLISNSHASEVSFHGKFVQGGIIIGHSSLAEKVFFDDRELQISNDGNFIFGFGRNHKKSSIIKLKFPKKTETYNVDIKKSDYKIEKIDGLPSKMVTPGPELYERIKNDRVLIGQALKEDYQSEKFTNKFIWPSKGRISGVFGSQRILNGIKKNPHGGLDIAAPTGTPIKAIADGKVLMAEKGLYYTGNIVIIGHGYKLKSMYIHMEDINVSKGDKVYQGDIIGTIGMTGRATGPHLHMNIYWNRIKINPELLLEM